LLLFAFGTIKDYFSKKDNYPELSENQLKKLRKLTILQICSERQNTFSYERLMKELVLIDSRVLEEIFIEAEYQDLLKCNINQKNQEIQVKLLKGRDIKEGDTQEIEEKLKKM
jgi:COP9 signalosome complex subunit 7